MLAGGDGRLLRPAASGRRPPDFDVRRLAMEIGSAETLSVISPIAPATAAATAAFAALFDTLLRRATRWPVVRGPEIIVWELLRECDCRVVEIPERELDDRDGRCVRGREVCRISYDFVKRDQHP